MVFIQTLISENSVLTMTIFTGTCKGHGMITSALKLACHEDFLCSMPCCDLGPRILDSHVSMFLQ